MGFEVYKNKLMENGYQEVDHIDLHDPKLLIHRHNWSDASAWVDPYDAANGERVVLDWEELLRLVKTFGFFPNKPEVNFSPIAYLLSAETPDDIQELWAKVEGPGLLSIKVVWENPEGEPSVSSVTYSGSFSVWWKSSVREKGYDIN